MGRVVRGFCGQPGVGGKGPHHPQIDYPNLSEEPFLST